VFSLIVIFVDDLIIIKAQSYLAIDWGALQIAEDEEVATKKMKSFREYNEQSERKLSFLLGSIAIIITAIFFLQGKEWHGAGGLLLTIFFLNQHKIGRNLARKTLTREIKYAFSGWLLDLALLLQSENVQVALEKSKLYVPGVLKVELFELVERLEKEPESAEPYHQFLQIFMIPEIHSAMSILYSLSIGNSGNADKQISELVEKNLEILDISEEEKIRNMGSGMYLLFLAPVLTASFKLLVDMVFLMLGFLQSSSF
ncbi:MAG: hypothetical protein IKJ01_02740, partial [Lachnospiraceae bacterium]|nr:hypothetical protein [Lachnospiraceae bacterium]